MEKHQITGCNSEECTSLLHSYVVEICTLHCYILYYFQLFSRIKAILVKGVITDDVVGRPTEIRFFYKIREEDNYVVYFPNFNLTARDPGNYGEMAMITLPLSVEARFVILGIGEYFQGIQIWVHFSFKCPLNYSNLNI